MKKMDKKAPKKKVSLKATSQESRKAPIATLEPPNGYR